MGLQLSVDVAENYISLIFNTKSLPSGSSIEVQKNLDLD